MFPVDPMVTDAINKCCRFAENDANSIGVPINTILKDLPHCPPGLPQMKLGTMFMRFPGRDVDGVSKCFRSNNEVDPNTPILPVKFHTVCCYGNAG